MNSQMRDLFLCSLTVMAMFYGFWFVLTEVLYTLIPFGIITSILLTGAIYYFRVPPPDSETVEEIIGKDLGQTTNDPQYVMRTVAHRGAGLDAPENSLTAFRYCNDKGCDAIEFDVSLTKDDIPIVFHDSNLERVADSDFVINEHTWEELAQIDISAKHPLKDKYSKTNIPTLEETVSQLLASGQRMFIDIKDNNSKFIAIIINLFDKHPELYSRAIVSSFFPNIIYFIRRQNPKIVCSLAWRPYAFSHESYNYPQGKGAKKMSNPFKHYSLCLIDRLYEWALPRIVYFLLGISVILLHKDVLSGKSIINWREKGVRVMVWTVNNPVEKQYVARILKITYLTDTLTGEGTTHNASF